MYKWLNFLSNYDYSASLVNGTDWTLDEAVDYLSVYKANKRNWASKDDAFRGFLNIRAQLVSTVQQGISGCYLFVNEVYNESSNDKAAANLNELDFRKSTVSPLVFIIWAITSHIEVPKQFKEYAAINKVEKRKYYEKLGVKKTCIHHERSRAIAELLWKIEPGLPVTVMACRREIIEIGCEGQTYDTRTIVRWLAPLKSDGKVGRPSKVAAPRKNYPARVVV